jgi:guanylate kinase
MDKKSFNFKNLNAVAVILGPYGAGKNFMCKEISTKWPSIFFQMKQCTTRVPRENETLGDEYFFLEHSTFLNIRDNLIAKTEIDNILYGTLPFFNPLSINIIIANSQGLNDYKNDPDYQPLFITKIGIDYELKKENRSRRNEREERSFEEFNKTLQQCDEVLNNEETCWLTANKFARTIKQNLRFNPNYKFPSLSRKLNIANKISNGNVYLGNKIQLNTLDNKTLREINDFLFENYYNIQNLSEKERNCNSFEKFKENHETLFKNIFKVSIDNLFFYNIFFEPRYLVNENDKINLHHAFKKNTHPEERVFPYLPIFVIPNCMLIASNSICNFNKI